MLDDLDAVDQVKGLLAEILEDVFVRSKDFESAGGAAFPSNPNAWLCEINAYHGISAPGELQGK